MGIVLEKILWLDVDLQLIVVSDDQVFLLKFWIWVSQVVFECGFGLQVQVQANFFIFLFLTNNTVPSSLLRNRPKGYTVGQSEREVEKEKKNE